MEDQVWQRVEEYIGEMVVGEDAVLRRALEASEAAGLPAINVTANQGKLLEILVRMIGAKRVLEVGTLGGYSTIWMARGLAAGGRILSLELEEHHAKVARKNIEGAGFGSVVQVRVG